MSVVPVSFVFSLLGLRVMMLLLLDNRENWRGSGVRVGLDCLTRKADMID